MTFDEVRISIVSSIFVEIYYSSNKKKKKKMAKLSKFSKYDKSIILRIYR